MADCTWLLDIGDRRDCESAMFRNQQVTDVFRREGFGEYTGPKYTRVRGHNLGLHVGENPYVLEDVDFMVDKGMVLIAHPNTSPAFP